MDPRSPEPPGSPLRAIVYGGDLAALETALALRRLCGEACEATLVSPVRDLPVRTQAAGASPAESDARPARFDLGSLAAEHGLAFRSDAIVAVDDEAREARTITGNRIPFDALVVAFGARPRGAIPGVTTCWGAGDAGALDGLLDEMRLGSARRVAFAIPRGVRWTLPTYELALTTARRIRREGLPGDGLFLVTHESRAVELLGHDAERVVTRRLVDAGIELITDRDPVAFAEGALATAPDGSVEVDCALSMAVVDGPRIAGLPRDSDGFLPVDGFGRVVGTERIWAAGEVTSFPVRQAGIAAQQALAVAASIAAEAGAAVESSPFRPSISGLIRSPAQAGSSNGSTTLWWPPEQLAGEHLSAHIGAKLAFEPPSDDASIAISVELGPDGRRLAGAKPEAGFSPAV
jgi:sulfide:quinone oxidoreductase